MLGTYGSSLQVKGFLQQKQLYTFDPKAMHHILVKDGSLYEPFRVKFTHLVFGKGLLNTLGDHHRRQRKMLNPVFSIAHMRALVPVFYDVVDQLDAAISQRVKDGPSEIDLLGWMARTALELIGQSGFGYSFDSMVDDQPKHKYSIYIKNLGPSMIKLAMPLMYILPLMLKLGIPANIRIFIMNITPWKALHDVRDMVNYMYALSVEVYEEKKRALAAGDEAVVNQIGKGKDLLSVLMRDNMKADSKDRLEESEIIAQMSTFIFAAMETTSSGISRVLHLLALNPMIQQKLRQEILEARKERQGARLNYDDLVALPYLDAICRETLRLYPPAPSIARQTTQDVIVPLSKPVIGVDGSEISQILLPKATRVTVSTLNANRSSELWGPDALEWKPDRWLSPLPESISNSKISGVYSHLMTFGAGSHACIGFKFSQLEMKVVVAMLVEKFKISLPHNKEIFWQMTGIVSPVVVGGDGHAQLPLVVEAI
ncbi:hypothetical protein GYMLUDRAFT_776852 [Collybiopsis luxurians FD-317 M1]|uniref:Cytochrome P450 n=1 Tax=Collybiopsis luxurians FD-317 M1 TaxID=944289 RepID=A0A0D0CFP6_9AGAR|nr:hypothetical protein GYMLUDRAFT_776852 [Collybiopsis luxurians FD-317 M1]